MKGKQAISKGHGVACLTKQTEEIVSDGFYAL